MTAPLLSICIATYNRGAFIGATLETIRRQLTDEVEVVVADGASTDNTPAVVAEICGRDPRIRYVRLPEKGGVDRDFCLAVEQARGEYCWLFCDDDQFKAGAIARVLDGIRRGFGLIVVNAEARTPDLAEVLFARLLPVEQDETVAAGDLERLFVRAANYLSFIGAVVIRRALWLERDARSYWGTEFVHVGVIFQQPLPVPALLLAEPLIAIRYGNAQWKARAFHIWMVAWPQLLWAFPGISAAAKRKVMAREPWRSLKQLLFYRGTGALTPAAFAYCRQHAAPWWWRLGAAGIMTLPVPPANRLCRLLAWLFIHGPARKMTAYELAQARQLPGQG